MTQNYDDDNKNNNSFEKGGDASTGGTISNPKPSNVLYRGSHIKVKLVGATIHEPINVEPPRTPFVFEIMAGKGISHVLYFYV